MHIAFHQQTADELGGDDLGRAGEEGLRECWEGVVAMGVAMGKVAALTKKPRAVT